MKYLFSDLDNTIVFNRNVDKKDLMAIRKFINSENKLIIATGRGYGEFEDATQRYTLDFNYAILAGGTIVINEKFDVIWYQGLEFNTAKNILEYITLQKVNLKELSLNYIDSTKVYEDVFFEMNDVLKNKNKIASISLRINVEQKIKIKSIVQYIKSTFDVSVEQNGLYIDILPNNISKRTGIEFLVEYLNIIEEKYFVIGDAWNDACMFQMTENSFTFTNSDNELKKMCSNVVNNFFECIELIMQD